MFNKVVLEMQKKKPALKTKRLNRVLLAKVVLSRYFLPTSWILLKQLFLSPEWALFQKPIGLRSHGLLVRAHSGEGNNGK